jgi:hypothetical protein
LGLESFVAVVQPSSPSRRRQRWQGETDGGVGIVEDRVAVRS